MKNLPLELIYRLYKADIGDVIDNTYVRLNGAWKTDDNRQPLPYNGFLESSIVYQFIFKDLSEGAYYQASNGASPARDSKYPSQNWCYEPFTINTLDPFPVYRCEYEARAVNTIYVIDNIPN
ncbi:hypothetical protein [Leclercia sp.]|uniref:hypothetical protein n=1 Tax=Leclercia sp. TaxID=1898428 RepID=UPI0028BD3093|nr:hypothetical protein [Leclercia sp.]